MAIRAYRQRNKKARMKPNQFSSQQMTRGLHAPWQFVKLAHGEQCPEAQAIGLPTDRQYVLVTNPAFSRIFASHEVQVLFVTLDDLELDAQFLLFHGGGHAAILLLDMQRAASQRYVAESLRSGFDFLVTERGNNRHYCVRPTVDNPDSGFDVSALSRHLDGMASRPPDVAQRSEFLTLAQWPAEMGTAFAALNGVSARAEVLMNPVFDEESFPTELDILGSQGRPLKRRKNRLVFGR